MGDDYQDIPWTERPDVEVLVDGVWCPGEIRARRRIEDAWQAYVHYSVDRDGYRHTLVAWLPYDEQLRLVGRLEDPQQPEPAEDHDQQRDDRERGL